MDLNTKWVELEDALKALPNYDKFEGPYNEVDDLLWKAVGDSHRYSVCDSMDRTLRFIEKHSGGSHPIWRITNMRYGIYGGSADIQFASSPYYSFFDCSGHFEATVDHRPVVQVALLLAWIEAMERRELILAEKERS